MNTGFRIGIAGIDIIVDVEDEEICSISTRGRNESGVAGASCASRADTRTHTRAKHRTMSTDQWEPVSWWARLPATSRNAPLFILVCTVKNNYLLDKAPVYLDSSCSLRTCQNRNRANVRVRFLCDCSK
ncbi:hypothetical protein EVAR_84361_1 [Eumeta japonica]|uniref:Uncharacterized protein n=1 Tax=Eumeta variegata TaxID=151549 RepID=A0A4C1U5W5_EUMVA|nr:hypothetical protein EVAR_84361_1 [Eumeta japonica]